MSAKRIVRPGQVFNKWKLLEEDLTVQRPGQYWRARCECGTIKTVRLRYIANGASTSCGCNKRTACATMPKRSQQLTALKQRFGKLCPKCDQIKPLTQFYKSKQNGDGHSAYCKVCTDIERNAYRNRKGLVKGGRWAANKRQVVAGERFGKLTIMEEVDVPGKIRFFRCKCDCGREKVIRLGNMVTGTSRSCGCMARNGGVVHSKPKQAKAPWAC